MCDFTLEVKKISEPVSEINKILDSNDSSQELILQKEKEKAEFEKKYDQIIQKFDLDSARTTMKTFLFITTPFSLVLEYTPNFFLPISCADFISRGEHECKRFFDSKFDTRNNSKNNYTILTFFAYLLLYCFYIYIILSVFSYLNLKLSREENKTKLFMGSSLIILAVALYLINVSKQTIIEYLGYSLAFIGLSFFKTDKTRKGISIILYVLFALSIIGAIIAWFIVEF